VESKDTNKLSFNPFEKEEEKLVGKQKIRTMVAHMYLQGEL
jgi:hypothetical protein